MLTLSKGLDILSMVKKKQLAYIDALSRHGGPTSELVPIAGLESLSLDGLSTAINTALQTTSAHAATSDKSVKRAKVIIDGIDFLLAAQAGVDAVRLQQFVRKTQSLCQSLVLTCSADSPLLHNRDEAATPIEREHSAFITTEAHLAWFVLQLRGLDSGTAKDVTGVLRVSQGGNYDAAGHTSSGLREGEWLYRCKGDGNVTMWTRGE